MRDLSKYVMHFRIGLIVLVVASIVNLVLIRIFSDPVAEEQAPKLPLVNLRGHDLLEHYGNNIYGLGPRVKTSIVGPQGQSSTLELDEDLLSQFYDALGLEGEPDMDRLLDCLLLESGFSLENLTAKEQLASLLKEYAGLIQNRGQGERLPVVLFVGGSKNMQTFFSGTDLIEFILAASYLERELTKRDIKVKVAPAYDLGMGGSGVDGHINYLTKSEKQVATSYPGAASKWHEEVKSFADKHRGDLPEHKLAQAAVISLLVDLEQSHLNDGKQPALHLVFITHGYRYRSGEERRKLEGVDRSVRLVPVYKTFDYVQETGLVSASSGEVEVDGGVDRLYYYHVDKNLRDVVTGNIGCHSEIGGSTYGVIDQMTRQMVQEMGRSY